MNNPQEILDRLQVYEGNIEKYKNRYTEANKTIIELESEYKKNSCKLSLQYKISGVPTDKGTIENPTVTDIRNAIQSALLEDFIRLETAQKQKEIALEKFKMTQTQISVLQSILNWYKEELHLQK